MEIKHNLRKARVLLGFSQSQVAELSGVSQTDISRIETGTRKFIPVEYFAFLASHGIDMNLIFSDEDIQFFNHSNNDSIKVNYNMIWQELNIEKGIQKEELAHMIASNLDELQERLNMIKKIIKKYDLDI
jgi:transcriptional regulator with XRE-family HTH domain